MEDDLGYMGIMRCCCNAVYVVMYVVYMGLKRRLGEPKP
jgi:hypothetical protein